MLKPTQLGYWGWEEQVDITLPGLKSSFCPEGFAQKLKCSWRRGRGSLRGGRSREPGAQAWPWTQSLQVSELTTDALLCLAWGFANLPAARACFLHALVLIKKSDSFEASVFSFSTCQAQCCSSKSFFAQCGNCSLHGYYYYYYFLQASAPHHQHCCTSFVC